MNNETKAMLDAIELRQLRAERDALRMENIKMRDTIAKYQFDAWQAKWHAQSNQGEQHGASNSAAA